ncbi:hypothetical protein M8J76_011252 [Diaphorina citri]|nr:hypothetical protein M8J76_011252 [Diaphorina citri]
MGCVSRWRFLTVLDRCLYFVWREYCARLSVRDCCICFRTPNKEEKKETISILSPNEFITEICAPSRVSPGGPGNFSRCSANDSQILSTFLTPNPAAKTLVTIPPCLSLPSWNPQILLAL